MNEVDKFFEGLPSQDTKIDDILTPEKEIVEEVEDSKSEGRKNRRHRRLEEALQAERESNIALAERIKVLAEVKDQSSSSSVDPDLIRVFGDTDAGKEVARIMEARMARVAEEAEERAVRKMEERQTFALEEQKKYESVIDSQLEALEDEYNTDLTSDSPKARRERREFLELVQSLSPKDENGSITAYADFGSTFEVYKNSREKADNSRQKEIASRSMQKSGSASGDKATDDANLKYLRSIGIKI